MDKKTAKKKISAEDLKKSINYAESGFTYEQAEGLLGLEPGNLKSHAKRSPAFKRKFENAVLEIINRIEHALIKRAEGFTTIETQFIFAKLAPKKDDDNVPEIEEKVIVIKGDENGINPAEYGMVLKEIRKVIKYVPPDNTAMIIYLINRYPERWSKNPTIADSGKSLEDILEDRKIGFKQATENI